MAYLRNHDLLEKTVYGAKISEIKGKYFTPANCDKFTNNITDTKIK